jgi:subtilisin family serine protease
VSHDIAAGGNQGLCGAFRRPACVSAAVKVAASYDGNYGYLEFPGYCDEFNAVPYWVTCFSNISENCDLFLAAPGYDIQVGGFAGDGTSQATTHCSGAAALVFSKNKWLDAGYVRGLMWATATDMPWAFPDCPLPPHPRHLNALAAVNSVAPAPQAGVLEGPAAYNAAEGSVAMEGCGRFVIAYHQRLAPGRNNQVDALFNLYDVDGTPLDPLLPRIGGLIIT